jgi:hypothetical protein
MNVVTIRVTVLHEGLVPGTYLVRGKGCESNRAAKYFLWESHITFNELSAIESDDVAWRGKIMVGTCGVGDKVRTADKVSCEASLATCGNVGRAADSGSSPDGRWDAGGRGREGRSDGGSISRRGSRCDCSGDGGTDSSGEINGSHRWCGRRWDGTRGRARSDVTPVEIC